MKELVAEKNELLQKIAKLEVKFFFLNKLSSFHIKKKVNENQIISFQNTEDKKKRHRRVATEIDRHYKCPFEVCQKSYGFLIFLSIRLFSK